MPRNNKLINFFFSRARSFPSLTSLCVSSFFSRLSLIDERTKETRENRRAFCFPAQKSVSPLETLPRRLFCEFLAHKACEAKTSRDLQVWETAYKFRTNSMIYMASDIHGLSRKFSDFFELQFVEDRRSVRRWRSVKLKIKNLMRQMTIKCCS